MSQDYPQEDYELIFVDNGSQDGSMEILQSFPEIRVFSEPERGSYAARNLGISKARGSILAFTDSDCYPISGWLQAIDSGLHHPETKVLLGPRIPPTSHRSIHLISAYENKKAELVYRSDDPMVYFGYTNNMAVQKSVMERFGPFVGRARGSDTIFIRSVVEGMSCDAVAYSPDMAVQHAELESIGAYYHKVKTYGRSRKAYRHITSVRPLSQKERLAVFWQATHKRPLLDAMHLFGLLLGGSIAWWFGGLAVSKTDF